jgi:hypothetical protein
MPTIQVHEKKGEAFPNLVAIEGNNNFTFENWGDVDVRWATGLHGEVISINVTNPQTRAKTYRYIHKSFCSIDLMNRYVAMHGNMNGW